MPPPPKKTGWPKYLTSGFSPISRNNAAPSKLLK